MHCLSVTKVRPVSPGLQRSLLAIASIACRSAPQCPTVAVPGRIECNAEEWIKGEPNEELVQIIKAGIVVDKKNFQDRQTQMENTHISYVYIMCIYIYINIYIYISIYIHSIGKLPIKSCRFCNFFAILIHSPHQAPAKPVKNTVALPLSPKRRLKGKKAPANSKHYVDHVALGLRR